MAIKAVWKNTFSKYFLYLVLFLISPGDNVGGRPARWRHINLLRCVICRALRRPCSGQTTTTTQHLLRNCELNMCLLGLCKRWKVQRLGRWKGWAISHECDNQSCFWWKEASLHVVNPEFLLGTSVTSGTSGTSVSSEFLIYIRVNKAVKFKLHIHKLHL